MSLLGTIAKGLSTLGSSAVALREVMQLVDYLVGDSNSPPPVLRRLPPHTRSKVQIARDRLEAAKAFGVDG